MKIAIEMVFAEPPLVIVGQSIMVPNSIVYQGIVYDLRPGQEGYVPLGKEDRGFYES